MKRITAYLVSFVVLVFTFIFFGPRQILRSAPSINVRDTLSSSQLSYFGRIGVGVSAGENLVKIAVNGSAPSRSTANLYVGDTLAIGSTVTGSNIYTVKDIGNTATIELATSIGTSNAWVGAYVVSTSSAIHTITFTPQSSVANGIWQVLIKATNRPLENSADGMPDQGGFDLGATTPSAVGPAGLGMRLLAADIACPFGAASVGTTTVLTNGVGLGSTGPYHIIQCTLSGGATNAIGTSAVWTIGRNLTAGAQLINPAPANGSHSEGTADTYTFFIRHAYNDGTLIDADTTAGKIAVIEAVRVSATVDPTITFYIDTPSNITTAGQVRCGGALSIGATNTTPTTVNFGPLALTAFNNVAQRFNITTNSKNGYIVQVYEDMPLTNVNSGATIPDAHCDTGTVCNTNTANTWILDNGSTSSQFGYSLEAGATSVGTSMGIGTTNNQYKAFGIGAANAKIIMQRSTTPSILENAYICYRATASNFQEAGNYTNSLTFVATATF